MTWNFVRIPCTSHPVQSDAWKMTVGSINKHLGSYRQKMRAEIWHGSRDKCEGEDDSIKMDLRKNIARILSERN